MMSSRTKKRLKKLVKNFLYILIVVLLLIALICLMNRSDLRKQERAEKIREVIEKESKRTLEEAGKETEGEFIEEKQENKASSSSNREETENEDLPINMATPMSSAEAEEEVSADAEEELFTDQPILILNGTGEGGVAAYWKEQLEQAGYTNVIPATYHHLVEMKTVIYCKNPEKAQVLLQQFPQAIISEGEIQEGIETAEGFSVPENCEAYIVVGMDDARSG